MFGVLAFWLGILLPGLVLVRRYAPVERESGVLGQIALGYLASFALFSPVAIAGYVLGGPLWLLSASIVVTVIAAAVVGIRTKLFARPEFEIVGLLCGLIVLSDMVLGARVGAHFGADAAFHIARIRMIADHGFNNWDPYIAGHHFSRIYHTNVYHALLAACSQLTGLLPVEVWSATLPWAKLVIASGAYYLTWTLLGERWIAWLAAAMVTIKEAPVTFVLYPNKIAPFWLVSLAFAFLIQVWTERDRWSLSKLAAVVLVTAQVHAMYAVFIGMLLGPVLAARAALALLRRESSARYWLTAGLTLALAAPFVLIARFGSGDVGETLPEIDPESEYADVLGFDTDAALDTPPTAQPHPAFIHLPDGRIMLDPSDWVDPTSLAFYSLLCLLAGLLTERRRRFVPLLGLAAVIALVFYVPSICTPVAAALGGDWVLARLGLTVSLIDIAIFPGVLLLLARRLTVYLPVRLMALVAAVLLALATGIDSKNWSRDRYLARARDTQRRLDRLTWARDEAAMLRKHVPPGSTILTQLGNNPRFVMLGNCYVIAMPAGRGSPGIPQAAQRRKALMRLLDTEAPWEARRFLLERHHVSRVVLYTKTAKALRRAYRPHATKQAKGSGVIVLYLDLGSKADQPR